MVPAPEIRYARSGDLSIAYQVFGDGPFDLVFVPGFVSHLELNWETKPIVEVQQRLASFARVICFDKRGTGLSDRTAGLPTLGERTDDIRAVMDAAGADRAAIVAVSEGGPAGVVFTATYPERVTALALWITAISPPRDEFDEALEALAEGFDSFLGDHWGDGSALRLMFGAGAPEDAATRALLSRYEHNAATPAAAQAVWRRTLIADARPFCSAVSTPALLVAHNNDPIIPLNHARWTANAIRGTKFVEIESDAHSCWDIARRPDLDAIEEFLTGGRQAPISDRALATVLYTDIVASTERATALGDRQWRDLLDRHDATIRRELERYKGREVKTTGDGILATFDGPARAIHCAQAIVEQTQTLGLDIRAGLHTGECEIRGDDVAGIAVHIGARVAALAGPGEVLVSRTVHDLVIGSDISLADRGEHALKGVAGNWQLFAVVT